MTVAPTLSDHQRWYRTLTIGPGTPYEILSEDGIEAQQMRVSDQPLPLAWGAVPGLHLVAHRSAVLTVEVHGDAASIEAATVALWAAFTPLAHDPAEYHLKSSGRPQQFVRLRVDRRPRRRDAETTSGIAVYDIGLVIADPRLYSSAAQQAVAPLYQAAGGGKDWNVDWNVDWGLGSAIDVVAHNAGGVDANPVVRFNGPGDGGTISEVRLLNRTNDDLVEVVTPVLSGQVLTVDLEAYVTGAPREPVLLSGASRLGSWARPHRFRLSPGDNLLRYEVTGTTTSTSCAIDWRDTNL